METRTLRAGCLLAGLLLLALALYPPSFVGLFTTATTYETQVSPVGTEAYQKELEVVNETGSPGDLRVVQYGALSSEAQTFVDRALERPVGSDEAENGGYERPVEADGAHVYDPDVCRPYAIACPGLSQDAVPSELSYEVFSPLDEVALFVERGDRRYLVTTPGLVRGAIDPGPAGPTLWAALRIAFLVPLGSVLVVLGAGSRTRRARAFLLAYAGLVAAVALSSGVDLLGSAWALPWLLPGLLTAPSSDDRLLGAGIAVGSLQATVALVIVYLAAYGFQVLDGGGRLFVGWMVGWAGAVVILGAAWALHRSGSDEPAAGSKSGS